MFFWQPSARNMEMFAIKVQFFRTFNRDVFQFDFSCCYENNNKFDFYRDAFTWENMEKVYFETTRKIGVFYSDFTGWVGRKVECLLSA